MVDFDDRENAFEKKEAMKEENIFKLTARRNRMLGEWVATLLNYDETETERYIKQVIASDFEEAGDEDVLRKVHADLNEAGKVITEEELRDKMNALLEEIRSEMEVED